MQAFAFAHGPDWRTCVEALGRPGRGLGFVYFTDALAGEADTILDSLKTQTGVGDWIGSVGTGILATGTEYQDGPALAAMVADLPGLVSDMSAKVDTGYIVGGVSSSRSRTVQIANEVLSGGLSGAVLGEEVAVATRLTQGCTPLPRRGSPGTAGRFRVTEGEQNIIARLDGRPALEVLLEAVGGERTQLLVGLPVPGSEAGAHFLDYTARNIVGIDPKAGLVAIGDLVEPGMEILFCKRDAAAAKKDLEDILSSLKRDAPHPRGALYYSCVARGEHMFGSRGAELDLVRRSLGEVPLVGFFCNGEISRDRLYGYTGVLTVFR